MSDACERRRVDRDTLMAQEVPWIGHWSWPAGEFELQPVPLENPTRETHLGPADIRPLTEVVVKFPVNTPAFERHRTSSHRVLVTAPFLQLVGGAMASERHVFVSSTEQTVEKSPTHVHLIDLTKGQVLDVDLLKAVYPSLELALVELHRAEKQSLYLLHLDDLREVPIGGYIHRDSEVRINPGLGDGWVFQFDPANPADARTKYAHWTDLREPPPAPDRELPFQPWDYYRSDADPYGDYLMSDPRHPFPTNLVVRNIAAPAPCNAAEMLPSGEFRCAFDSLFLGGWRVTQFHGKLAFVNDDTREVQWLDLLEHCGAYDGVFRRAGQDLEDFTPFPPRLMFGCSEEVPQVLWSPGVLEVVPRGEGARPQWTSNRWLVTEPQRQDSPDGRGSPTRWLDLAHRKFFRTAPSLQYSTYEVGETMILTPRSDPNGMWVMNLENGTARRVFSAPECARIDSEFGNGRWWAVSCLDSRERMLWSEVFDGVAGLRWRLPAVDGGALFSRLWMHPTARTVVGVVHVGKQDELHVWQLD